MADARVYLVILDAKTGITGPMALTHGRLMQRSECNHRRLHTGAAPGATCAAPVFTKSTSRRTSWQLD